MPFVNKFKILVCTACLAFVGQGFAALDCNTGTVWGEFTTQSASKAKDGYYVIDTPEKLAWVACKTTNGELQSEKFKLTQDIDLEGKLFIPIAAGKGDARFKGILDGKGFTIKGLYIKGSEITKEEVNGNKLYAQNIGLVAILSGSGAIRNLVLEVSEIYASSSAGDDGTVGKDNPISVGTLVGWMESGKIENCVVEGTITTSGNSNRVGGLAGNVWSATITDCVSNVSISASGSETHVGGIVGALRKGKTVTLSSCVFDGDTLISTGGTAGGIVGYHEEATVVASNLYYTGAYDGTGKPLENVTIPTNQTSDEQLNSEEVVCALNKGTWDAESEICTNAKSDAWSEGQTGISMNGSDGYKVSFNANGGTFVSGAKTFKIVANGATITADEITEPTLANKKFAGWATTAGADKPGALGVASANTTIYAVWYDFYTVTFELCDTVSYFISVPKHGHVSMEGFTVPSSYKVPDAESEGDSIKYYFTGWGPEAKWLGFYIDPISGDTVKIDPTPDDTLHLASIDVLKDTTLYPVWTRAETYSVTFDATLHGKTHVRFVKKVNQGDPVEEPNDVVTNPGYKIIGWCTNANTTECSEYDFDAPLTKNLTLYAEWDTLSYTITYMMKGGTNNNSNPLKYTVESDTIIFAEPTYDGNTFGGWFYDAGFTSPATGIATGSTTGDKIVYAKWTPIFYTIEYLSGNEVSATIVADKMPWGADWTLKGEEFAFQREGYIHDGWSRVKNGALSYAFGATYSENEDLILYPHWTPKAFPIVYHNIEGATFETSNPETYTIESGDITLNNPSKTGYNFLGWFLSENSDEPIDGVAIASGSTGEKTFYAKWEFAPSPITVTASSGTFEFDKQTHNATCSYEGTLPTGYSIEMVPSGSVKNVADGEVTTTCAVTIKDESDNDVTDMFTELTVVNGTISVVAKAVPYGAVTIYTDETGNRAVIDGEYAGEGVIEINGDIEVKEITFNREFAKGSQVYSTIMFPFSIAKDKVSGGKFYGLKDVDENYTVSLTSKFGDVLEANTPYIVEASADRLTFDLKGDDKVIFNTTVKNAKKSSNGLWELLGTYEFRTWKADDDDIGRVYGFAAKTSADPNAIGQFRMGRVGTKIKPMRAYLLYTPVPASAPAPLTKSSVVKVPALLANAPDELNVVIDEDDGETTFVGTLNAATGEIKIIDNWFDMKGRKLNAKPTTKGIYYYNGKRVIVR